MSSYPTTTVSPPAAQLHGSTSGEIDVAAEAEALLRSLDEPLQQTTAKPDRRWRRRFIAFLAAFGLVTATVAVSPGSSAQASTVRAGARFAQVDILLDGTETQRAATSYWGAQTVCWGVTAAAAGIGSIYGGVLANLSCTAVVSVCAAQAYYAHRWAGMTVYPGGFFCWKY